MANIKTLSLRGIGLVGALACIALFVKTPSFPTPDKLFVFLLFVFLFFEQALEMLKRLGPFVVLLLVYESFRSIVPHLNRHVHYGLAPHMDKLLFGNLPTKTLQNWLWTGHTRWYDIALYIPYLLFFVVPFGLALLVWKTKDKYYWQVVTTYLLVFFAGFLTFLIYPAAPPWLASQNHFIEPITRISTNVWFSLGIHDFPSVYNHLAPNPVAALPSLHAACATLLTIFVFKLYGKRWGFLSMIYPVLIYIGVVYEGEHYVFDVAVGVIYAVVGYLIAPAALAYLKRIFRLGRKSNTAKRPRSRYASSTKNV